MTKVRSTWDARPLARHSARSSTTHQDTDLEGGRVTIEGVFCCAPPIWFWVWDVMVRRFFFSSVYLFCSQRLGSFLCLFLFYHFHLPSICDTIFLILYTLSSSSLYDTYPVIFLTSLSSLSWTIYTFTLLMYLHPPRFPQSDSYSDSCANA
ncbi:hypothetical protein B0H17DRAFT_156917 [Mycena rosella]|uniref:Uncharacterized protein n=1 Tax=Mycena rosella TaxID=1033263 RepID=A0AAD7D250_MYCRO|nr:hypothetical protein B0H17DRAFT_156917 [Mycena rosella]